MAACTAAGGAGLGGRPRRTRRAGSRAQFACTGQSWSCAQGRQWLLAGASGRHCATSGWEGWCCCAGLKQGPACRASPQAQHMALASAQLRTLGQRAPRGRAACAREGRRRPAARRVRRQQRRQQHRDECGAARVGLAPGGASEPLPASSRAGRACGRARAPASCGRAAWWQTAAGGLPAAAVEARGAGAWLRAPVRIWRAP